MLIAAIKLHIIMLYVYTYLQSKIKDRLPSYFAQHTEHAQAVFNFGNLRFYLLHNAKIPYNVDEIVH